MATGKGSRKVYRSLGTRSGVLVGVGVFVLVAVEDAMAVGVEVFPQSCGGLLGGPHGVTVCGTLVRVGVLVEGVPVDVGVADFFAGASPVAVTPCCSAKPANVAPTATNMSASSKMTGRLECMTPPASALPSRSVL